MKTIVKSRSFVTIIGSFLVVSILFCSPIQQAHGQEYQDLDTDTTIGFTGKYISETDPKPEPPGDDLVPTGNEETSNDNVGIGSSDTNQNSNKPPILTASGKESGTNSGNYSDKLLPKLNEGVTYMTSLLGLALVLFVLLVKRKNKETEEEGE